MIVLMRSRDFFLARMKATKVLEEYFWATTQSAGGHAAADKVPLCWSLDLTWTVTYLFVKHVVDHICTQFRFAPYGK